jgi:hypothetical protein
LFDLLCLGHRETGAIHIEAIQASLIILKYVIDFLLLNSSLSPSNPEGIEHE